MGSKNLAKFSSNFPQDVPASNAIRCDLLGGCLESFFCFLFRGGEGEDASEQVARVGFLLKIEGGGGIRGGGRYRRREDVQGGGRGAKYFFEVVEEWHGGAPYLSI